MKAFDIISVQWEFAYLILHKQKHIDDNFIFRKCETRPYFTFKPKIRLSHFNTLPSSKYKTRLYSITQQQHTYSQRKEYPEITKKKSSNIFLNDQQDQKTFLVIYQDNL